MKNDEVEQSYLLGLLAKIKCSICSYQCENWYLPYLGSFFHINFFWGRSSGSLAYLSSRVAMCIALLPCAAYPLLTKLN